MFSSQQHIHLFFAIYEGSNNTAIFSTLHFRVPSMTITRDDFHLQRHSTETKCDIKVKNWVICQCMYSHHQRIACVGEFYCKILFLLQVQIINPCLLILLIISENRNMINILHVYQNTKIIELPKSDRLGRYVTRELKCIASIEKTGSMFLKLTTLATGSMFQKLTTLALLVTILHFSFISFPKNH